MSLEQSMDHFLKHILGGERIDDLLKAEEQKTAQKADFFLDDRNVVLELKSLQKEQDWRVQKVLDRWRKERDWPDFVGQLNLVDALKDYPRHE